MNAAGEPRADATPASPHSLGSRRFAYWFLGVNLFAAPALGVASAFYPFILPKQVLGSLAIDLAAIALLVGAGRSSAARLRVSPSLILLLGTVAAECLSIALGVDRLRGLWGTAERMDGLLFQPGFWLLFGLVVTGLVPKAATTRLVRWFVLGAVPTFLYAIGQRLGWSWTTQGTEAWSSTFGNPAFFGTYLTFAFWLSVYLLAADPVRAWRPTYAGIAVASVVFLFLAHSRAPLVGWFLGLCLLLVITVASARSIGVRRWAIAGTVIAVLLASAVFVFRGTPAIQSIPGVSRLARAGAGDPTTRLRLVNARVALAGFAERPIMGWGLNGYTYIYQRHFDPANLGNDPHLYDKAHNLYAEILSEQGIVGFLAYALFIGYLVFMLWPGRSLGDRMLLCGLATYLIQSAFLFDTPVTRLASMLLFGLVAAQDPRGWTLSLPRPRLRWPLVVLAAGLLIAHMAILGRTFLQSREASIVAYKLPGRTSDSTYVQRTMDRFLDQHSFMDREVLTELAQASTAMPTATPATQAFKRQLLGALRKDFDSRPNDYRLGVDLLKTASDLSTRDTRARAVFSAYAGPVTALAPRRPEAYMLAGEMAFRDGQVEEGKRQYLAAARLNPALAFPYWALGRELAMVGRAQEAKPLVEAALARGFDYRSAAALTTLIRIYYSVGDSVQARHYVAVARMVAPSVMDSTITQ